MSIASEITRISNAVDGITQAVSSVGGDVSGVSGIEDLPNVVSTLNNMASLTLSEYEALSTTEQNNGTLYVIVE